MKNVILLFCLSLLTNNLLAQPKPKPQLDWHTNRYYMEISPLFGVNKYYHKKFDENNNHPNSVGLSGAALSFVVGGSWYQLKYRLFANSDANWPVYWLGTALLFGVVRHRQHSAFDVNVGIGYQLSGYETVMEGRRGGTLFIDNTDRQLGIVTELHYQIMTTAFGISPFLFGNFNLKAYSLGLGIAIMLGKPGYNNKEWEKVAPACL